VGVYGGCLGLSRSILGLFYIEKQGLVIRLGKEDGSVAALLKNQLTLQAALFWTLLSHDAY
jgi:hypothetical protein